MPVRRPPSLSATELRARRLRVAAGHARRTGAGLVDAPTRNAWEILMIGPKKLEQAEHWLARYEAGGVFFARLLPVVRHLISIPAGIVRMNFGIFSFVTIAGSALWCWILAYLGDKAYRVEPELLTSPEALEHFIRQQSKGILLVIVVFAALYMLTLRLMKPRSGS